MSGKLVAKLLVSLTTGGTIEPPKKVSIEKSAINTIAMAGPRFFQGIYLLKKLTAGFNARAKKNATATMIIASYIFINENTPSVNKTANPKTFTIFLVSTFIFNVM